MATRRKSISPAFLCLLALCSPAVRRSLQMRKRPMMLDPGLLRSESASADCYKVGHWTPICVDTSGLTSLEDARIEVTVIDSDGVDNNVNGANSSNRRRGQQWRRQLFTPKLAAWVLPFGSSLIDGDTSIAQTTLRPAPTSRTLSLVTQLPPTSELIVGSGFGSNRTAASIRRS